MNKRERSIYAILTTAIELFRSGGYQNTSVRQIAEKAGVSLGMVNHYFGSKEYLGAQILALLDSYAERSLSGRLSFDEDPILYDLVSVRVLFNYMMERGYREFYLDSLRCDFFFNYLSSYPSVLIDKLKQFYSFEASEDDVLLYSRYLPYMMEKTLILKKADSIFPTISYDEVPYLICQTAMNHFIPESDIRARDTESRRIAEEISQTLQDVPPEDVLLDFVHRFDAALQQISANTGSFRMQQLSSTVF